MEESEQMLKYLRNLRGMVGYNNANCGMAINAVYITPAQSLRNQADEMESREKLLKEIDEFLSHY